MSEEKRPRRKHRYRRVRVVLTALLLCSASAFASVMAQIGFSEAKGSGGWPGSGITHSSGHGGSGQGNTPSGNPSPGQNGPHQGGGGNQGGGHHNDDPSDGPGGGRQYGGMPGGPGSGGGWGGPGGGHGGQGGGSGQGGGFGMNGGGWGSAYGGSQQYGSNEQDDQQNDGGNPFDQPGDDSLSKPPPGEDPPAPELPDCVVNCEQPPPGGEGPPKNLLTDEPCTDDCGSNPPPQPSPNRQGGPQHVPEPASLLLLAPALAALRWKRRAAE
jgi:hypothetical protein